MEKLVKYIFIMIAIVIPFTTVSSENPANSGANEYLAFAEEMPAPVGGLKALYKKISYPTIAKKAKLEGKVFLLTYIDEKGNVTDVNVVKGIGGGCDEAASEAVKSTKFEPGKNQGQPVKVKLSLTISFKLK
jgi:protein TonB